MSEATPPGPRSDIPTSDRLAVADLLTRYTHNYDFGLPEGLGDLFTNSALFETCPQPSPAPDGYPFPAEGREAIVAALAGFQEIFRSVRRRHMVDFPSLTPIEGGDLASFASFVVVHSAPGASTEIVGAGTYEDVIARETDGKWRIRHRVVHRDRRGPQAERFY